MLYVDCSYQLREHSGGTCKEEAKINFSLEGNTPYSLMADTREKTGA